MTLTLKGMAANKSMKSGFTAENGRIVFTNGITINVTQITYIYNTSDESELIPRKREICYYRLSSSAKYYGYRISKNPATISVFKRLYFDQFTKTLQSEIEDFRKKPAFEKAKYKNDR